MQYLRGFGAILAVSALLLLMGAAAGEGARAQLSTSNADKLSLLWDFPLGAGVTARPVLANGLLYAASWDGSIYALDPETGALTWSFNTGSGAFLIGSQSTPLATPDGRVLIGDSLATVWSLNGATGAVIWSTSVGTPVSDNIWSGLATANGRLLVSVASLLDNPCTNGRVVALDLATGGPLWTLPTVPTGVCRNDTATTCTLDSECAALGPVPLGGAPTGVDPNALCMPGLGAGVTATVSFDPTGDFAYMNTVGCFTYPSIGDSDTIFKIDAATGIPVWKTRVNPPEQVGACDNDLSIDCGTVADCSGVGGTCTKKENYHDYGFLNGPTPVEIDDGFGGTKTVLVTGSKDGTLYALNEPNGDIEWTNAVLPIPITPDFAGFGLFNGPVTIADGRVHAALFEFQPPTVPEPDHLQAFDVDTGVTLWTDDIGAAWSGTTVANGVLLVATNATPVIYAYDAATGVRLKTLSLPDIASAQATVDDDTVYVAYGIFGATGGVRAYRVKDPIAREQQGCINTLNRDFSKVAGIQSRENCSCIRDASRGKLSGTIEDCLVADRRGVVARAKTRTLLNAEKKCTSPASFGPNDAAVANAAAVEKEIDLIHDIFGSPLDGGVIVEQAVNRDTAKCQQSVARTTKRCQDVHLREFNRCKRTGLRDGTIVNSFTLEQCLDADPRDRILVSCGATLGKIRRDIDRRCVSRGVDLSDAFPGCGTDDPATLAECLEASVACRACEALNDVDGLARDCDDYDDGLANESCP